MAAKDGFGPHVPVFRKLTSPEGGLWLSSLPALVSTLEEKWGVETGAPCTRGVAGWTAPAMTAGGEPVVLKVGWPHREACHEADALRLWAGAGAVRVLRSDPARWAMLIERCVPGAPFDESGLADPDALEAAAAVLRQLWAEPPPDGGPFERLGDVTREWADLVRERMDRHRPPFDPGPGDAWRRAPRDTARRWSHGRAPRRLQSRQHPVRQASAVAGHRPQADDRGCGLRPRAVPRSAR